MYDGNFPYRAFTRPNRVEFFFIAMKNSIASSHLYDDRMSHKKNQCKILFWSKVMTWYWIYAIEIDEKEENKIKSKKQ